MCVSLVNSDDFLSSQYLKSTLNEDGSIDVGYSAYSCDSSFYETLQYKFCPYCGQPINKIIERYQNEKQAKIEQLKAKAEQDKQKQIERNIQAKNERLIQIQNEVSNGNYNVYLYNGVRYSAYNKKQLKAMINITNSEMKNAKLIERYQKHKLQKE